MTGGATGADAALRVLARDSGVQLDFTDMNGQRHETPPESLRALLGALGVDASTEAAVTESTAERLAQSHNLPPQVVVMAERAAEVAVAKPCDWSLVDEDGRELQAGRAESVIALAPASVGYAVLHAKGEDWREESLVLIRPDHAPHLDPAVAQVPGWGVTGALYGLRSAHNGGLGNYDDLARASEALGRIGAQFLGINPVHALGWAAEDTISPYSPSHRGFFNIDHIAVEGGLGPCPKTELVDYAAFRSRHREALQAEYATTNGAKNSRFRKWAKAEGAPLEDFAIFEALSLKHGPDARKWPEALRVPGTAARKAAGTRTSFHRWLQWRAAEQIGAADVAAREAGMPLGLYLDLAVGSRPGGAEDWMHGDTIARGVTVGAPPDQLSPEGQSWNLVAHAPNLLASQHYRPLRAMLRRLMDNCGLLRIDHALGLMRSFWLPDDGSPGAYISQPFDVLLAVVAIEAHQAGCVVVGEDLGLVPGGFREKMNAAGLYSYAVWQYETYGDYSLHPPSDLRPFSLACFATHDTPTLAGFWYGTDIELWRDIGWINGGEANARHGGRAHQRNSLRQHCLIPDNSRLPDIGAAIHGALSGSPAALVAVQLDDIFGRIDAANLPGTIDEHPNWRRRLPVAVEDLPSAPEVTRIGETMGRRRALPSLVPAAKGSLS